MEELSLDNILDGNQIDDLFGDKEDTQDTELENKEENRDKDNKETTEIDAENIFAESESVGSEDDSKEKEDTPPDNTGSSHTNFYSSITKALMEDGIFPDLDDETISNVKNPEDLADIIEQQIQAKFDERQKRIDDALNAGIEESTIQQYDNTIKSLNSITDAQLEEEGDKGEHLRKQLIYQDFINKGFSKERAQRELNKSLSAGTDIEDAKEALKSNKEFFLNEYDALIKEAKEEEVKFKAKRQEEAEKLRTSILNDKKVFGDIEVDKATRQKIYDNISRPTYKDELGNYMTEIQKYQKENPTDFMKNVSLIYTLTDGFKNIDKLVKSKVNKEVKKGLRELEHTLNNTARTSDGNLRFVSSVNDDPESFIGKGWSIDV